MVNRELLGSDRGEKNKDFTKVWRLRPETGAARVPK